VDDLTRLTRPLFDGQHGVAARSQLIELGLDDNDLRRLVRQRRLALAHRGVYANHTGRLQWAARSMAAVLFHPHSALCHRSALDLAGDPIHVAIEHPRNGTELPGVVLHRVRHLEERVQWHRTPPRLRIEEAALDVAADARSLTDAVAVLTGVVQRSATTAERLLERLEARSRMPRGAELREVLQDVAAGSHSVLERHYRARVQRPHGLPAGQSQVRAIGPGRKGVRRDVLHHELRLVLELDGRAWHDTAEAREDDGWRDLTAARDGLLTLRLGWPHAHERPCRTALELGAVMQARGWVGHPRRCRPGCLVVGSVAGTE
jgi:hypothetical protein